MQMLYLCVIITVNTAEDDMLCHGNILWKFWSSAVIPSVCELTQSVRNKEGSCPGRMVTFVVTRQKHCNKGCPEYAAHLLF